MFSALVTDFFKVTINPENNFYFQNIEMFFHLSCSAICLQYSISCQVINRKKQNIIRAIDIPAYLIR